MYKVYLAVSNLVAGHNTILHVRTLRTEKLAKMVIDNNQERLRKELGILGAKIQLFYINVGGYNDGYDTGG